MQLFDQAIFFALLGQFRKWKNLAHVLRCNSFDLAVFFELLEHFQKYIQLVYVLRCSCSTKRSSLHCWGNFEKEKILAHVLNYNSVDLAIFFELLEHFQKIFNWYLHWDAVVRPSALLCTAGAISKMKKFWRMYWNIIRSTLQSSLNCWGNSKQNI